MTAHSMTCSHETNLLLPLTIYFLYRRNYSEIELLFPAAAGLYGSFPVQHDLPEGIHGGGDSQELLHCPETGPVLPLCRVQ